MNQATRFASPERQPAYSNTHSNAIHADDWKNENRSKTTNRSVCLSAGGEVDLQSGFDTFSLLTGARRYKAMLDQFTEELQSTKLLNSPEGRLPQAQVSPLTALFSVAERSQVH